MIRWSGLAPWEFEFPFPGSLTSNFLQVRRMDNYDVSPMGAKESPGRGAVGEG